VWRNLVRDLFATGKSDHQRSSSAGSTHAKPPANHAEIRTSVVLSGQTAYDGILGPLHYSLDEMTLSNIQRQLLELTLKMSGAFDGSPEKGVECTPPDQPSVGQPWTQVRITPVSNISEHQEPSSTPPSNAPSGPAAMLKPQHRAPLRDSPVGHSDERTRTHKRSALRHGLGDNSTLSSPRSRETTQSPANDKELLSIPSSTMPAPDNTRSRRKAAPSQLGTTVKSSRRSITWRAQGDQSTHPRLTAEPQPGTQPPDRSKGTKPPTPQSSTLAVDVPDAAPACAEATEMEPKVPAAVREALPEGNDHASAPSSPLGEGAKLDRPLLRASSSSPELNKQFPSPGVNLSEWRRQCRLAVCR